MKFSVAGQRSLVAGFAAFRFRFLRLLLFRGFLADRWSRGRLSEANTFAALGVPILKGDTVLLELLLQSLPHCNLAGVVLVLQLVDGLTRNA